MAKRNPGDRAAIANANKIVITLRKFPNFWGWNKKDFLKAWSTRTGSEKPAKGDHQAILFALQEYAHMNGVHGVLPSVPRRKAKKARKDYGGNGHFTHWRLLRYEALKRSGGRCDCCGATPESSGRPLHVDHIKPKSIYPDLEFKLENLQVLCEDCNIGKGNWDETNWRDKREEERATIALDIECGDELRRRLN